MGSTAGKVVFLLTSVLVVAFTIALNAQPRWFAGSEKAVFLAMVVVGCSGMVAYFRGVTVRTMVVWLGLVIAAAVIYGVYGGSGDPFALLHRLAATF
jgi:hypothetical protein